MSRKQAREKGLKEVPPEKIPAFNRMIGLQKIRAGEGRAEITLELRPEHRNRRGVAHGGLLSAMLDAALGGAVVSAIRDEEWCGTAQLSVQFRHPGTGPVLTGRGRMERRGRRLAFAEGEVVDSSGRIVATALGTWYVWPSHPGTPPDGAAS